MTDLYEIHVQTMLISHYTFAKFTSLDACLAIITRPCPDC